MKLLAGFLITVLFLAQATFAFAHVTVKPAQVGVGAFQTFTISVPSEKDNPTVEIRLALPEGLEHVTPTVKSGWTITTQKAGDMKGRVLNSGEVLSEEEANQIISITWTGGSIPAGQRDDFSFSAKVPSESTELVWKAYQTYSDGTLMAWDQENQDEYKESEDENIGPSSQTEVVNDLAPMAKESSPPNNDKLPIILSLIALALAGTSLFMQLRKK